MLHCVNPTEAAPYTIRKHLWPLQTVTAYRAWGLGQVRGLAGYPPPLSDTLLCVKLQASLRRINISHTGID